MEATIEINPVEIYRSLKAKINTWAYNKFLQYTINYFSKTCFENKNDDYVLYAEQGIVTNGLARPIVAAHAAIAKYVSRSSLIYILGLSIHSDDNHKYFVTLETNRPGLFIGKMGDTITKIEKELSKIFKRKVEIKIVECEPVAYMICKEEF